MKVRAFFGGAVLVAGAGFHAVAEGGEPDGQGLDLSFGNEIDAIVSKAITKRVTVLAKGAMFRGENGQPDGNRASLEADIVY